MTPEAMRAHDVLLRERRAYYEQKARYMLAAKDLARRLDESKQTKEQKQ